MAVTEASFKADFPEFANTPSAIVARSIVAAESQVDETVFGDDYDLAVEYLTAHHVFTDPRGEPTAHAYGRNPNVVMMSAQNNNPVLRGTSRYLMAYEAIRSAIVLPYTIA